jgi:SARP family transcriptional regulator, regulator of embCAB operon
LWYSLLGDLRISDGDSDHTPTARRVRSVLALLLVNANSVVTPEGLIEELWGEFPPVRAGGTLQTYIYQIRKLLADCKHRRRGADRLITRTSGYVLEVATDDVDTLQMERLTANARDAILGGDWTGAAKWLKDAIRLWRGDALSGVELGARLEAHAEWLKERRLSMLEQYADLELRLGHGRDLVGDLKLMARQHPFHEGLHARLMLALQMAGRRGDALNVFHSMRVRLSHELGVDPSMELLGVYQALLSTQSNNGLFDTLRARLDISDEWPVFRAQPADS